MANIIIPRKIFEKHVKLTSENIDKISLFGTPLECIDKESVEIEIFPNRPDLLSVQNYLRSFKEFLKAPSKPRSYEIKKESKKEYTVKVEAHVKDVRPFISCAIIKNLKFNDETIKDLIDLQEKLHNTIGRKRKKVAIGVYPLNKIQLPIVYTAKSPNDISFQPLESKREMNATQILKGHPKGKEFAHLLEHATHYPLFHDSTGEILSLPPIINSERTGKVTTETKDLFVECSGSDQATLNATLNILCAHFGEMGGELHEMHVHYPDKKIVTPQLEPRQEPLNIEHTNKLLGLELNEKDLTHNLAKMGIGYEKGNATIPAWRTDILHEVDLIEDVAIGYGYDQLVPELAGTSTTGETNKHTQLEEIISEQLTGLGITEIATYHLIKSDEVQKTKLTNPVELIDSKTEYKYLRQNLIAPLLRILSENKDREYPQNLYEIGTVFEHDEKEETGIRELEHLIISYSPGNYTRLKQAIEYLANILDFDLTLEETTHPLFVDGRTAKININGKNAGTIGELHPKTLQNWNINMPTGIIEIDLTPLLG